jgi:hypothetical protein
MGRPGAISRRFVRARIPGQLPAHPGAGSLNKVGCDGPGFILLNSNAETHFSFTNALGIITVDQARGIETAAAQFPQAYSVIALHHHPVEYPRVAKTLAERIGTALINGKWFVRRLRPLAGRAVLMRDAKDV